MLRISTTSSLSCLRQSARNQRVLLSRNSSTTTTVRPRSFRGAFIGFFLGTTVTGLGSYFYLVDQYRTSTGLLFAELASLQRAVRNLDVYVRDLESQIPKK